MQRAAGEGERARTEADEAHPLPDRQPPELTLRPQGERLDETPLDLRVVVLRLPRHGRETPEDHLAGVGSRRWRRGPLSLALRAQRAPLPHVGTAAREHLRGGGLCLPLRAVVRGAGVPARPAPAARHVPGARDVLHARRLLHDVGELVGQRAPPALRRRCHGGSEGDVPADRHRSGPRSPRPGIRLLVGVQAHRAEVVPEAPLHRGPQRRVERHPVTAPRGRVGGATGGATGGGLGRALGGRPREDGHGGHPAAVSRRPLARRGWSGAGPGAAGCRSRGSCRARCSCVCRGRPPR